MWNLKLQHEHLWCDNVKLKLQLKHEVELKQTDD